MPTIGPSSVPMPPMITMKIIATTQLRSKPVVTVMNSTALKLIDGKAAAGGAAASRR